MLDPRNSPLDKSNFPLFDPFRNINSNHPDKTKRQTPERHDDWEGEKEIELRLLESEEDDSGIQSPPLWKNNNPIMHPLSPNSRRREAIIRGQRELMDMVKNIPESCYELSLKDLVEHIPRSQDQEEFLLEEKNNNAEDDDEVGVQVHSNRQQGSKKFEKKRSIGVENINNNNKGLFLKMVFPVGNRSKKSIVLLNSSSSRGSNSSKLDVNGKTSNSNGDEKYWWKKRFSMSSESSDSGGSSTTSRRSRSHSRSITSSSSSNRSTSVRERRSILNNCMMTCFRSSKHRAVE